MSLLVVTSYYLRKLPGLIDEFELKEQNYSIDNANEESFDEGVSYYSELSKKFKELPQLDPRLDKKMCRVIDRKKQEHGI